MNETRESGSQTDFPPNVRQMKLGVFLETHGFSWDDFVAELHSLGLSQLQSSLVLMSKPMKLGNIAEGTAPHVLSVLKRLTKKKKQRAGASEATSELKKDRFMPLQSALEPRTKLVHLLKGSTDFFMNPQICAYLWSNFLLLKTNVQQQVYVKSGEVIVSEEDKRVLREEFELLFGTLLKVTREEVKLALKGHNVDKQPVFLSDISSDAYSVVAALVDVMAHFADRIIRLIGSLRIHRKKCLDEFEKGLKDRETGFGDSMF